MSPSASGLEKETVRVTPEHTTTNRGVERSQSHDGSDANRDSYYYSRSANTRRRPQLKTPNLPSPVDFADDNGFALINQAEVHTRESLSGCAGPELINSYYNSKWFIPKRGVQFYESSHGRGCAFWLKCF